MGEITGFISVDSALFSMNNMWDGFSISGSFTENAMMNISLKLSWSF